MDRNDGQVYAPLSPLLSPLEIALRSIRSQPIPLVILPEEADITNQTGYDAAYDIAMGDELPSPDDSNRAVLESEYAAAELAAATDGFELTPPSRTWELISGSLAAVRADLVNGSRHLQRSYVEPISRGVENRLLQMPLPTLTYPRAKSEARKLLLYYRAETISTQNVTWDDYLGFVGRELPVEPSDESEPRVARQKSPRNVLWPR